jgi:ABC transporter DrrB family efflux protein
MTTPTIAVTTAARTPGLVAGRRLLRQASLVTGRHLVETSRMPDVLLYTIAVPIVLALLVNYGFGGAIAPHGDYAQQLIPAIYILAAAEIGFTTAAGTATDLHTGLVDRFRSLPISRTALPLGRTLSDAVRHLVSIVVLTGLGYALGFRFDSPTGALATIGIALAFGFAVNWLAICLGASVPNAETAASASLLLLLLPLFASSALVPIHTMPAWLEAIARNSPYTAVIDTLRGITTGHPDTTNLWHTAIWATGILAVAAPLATRLYRRPT